MSAVASNAVIIIIIALLLIFAAKNSVAHFKGQGACCGGGGKDVLTKPKKLKSVFCVKTVRIDGMHCEHCYARVHNVLNSMEGVSAKVKGKKGLAVVKMEKDVDDQILSDAITALGYTVLSIRKEKK